MTSNDEKNTTKEQTQNYKNTQQSCNQSRGWNAYPTVVPLKPPRCCGEDHTHCAHGTRHPQPGVLQLIPVLSAGFRLKDCQQISWFIMVYHGLSSLFWGYIMWWVTVYHAIRTTCSERYLEDQTIPFLGVTVSWSVERIGICLTKVVT